MRILPFIVSAIITVGLVYALNRKWGDIPPMGKFLSPQHGFWQNAEPANSDFSDNLSFPGLKGKAEVYFDERLVPHIFAENDEDAYFIQGWLHAKFRLWQMEFQTLATAGRISEIIGEKAVNYDREQRRMGLTYGAENMLTLMEGNENTRKAVESYGAGINAYITSMKESELPVEYKLLDYKPEKWNNLKTALFIKQVTKTLSGYGYSNDFQYTNLRTIFTDKEINILFPDFPDSLSPVIPQGTIFPVSTGTAMAPENSDSVYLGTSDSIQIDQTEKPNPGKGSNNWAVSGKKSSSGSPILCNDPHLELTFPSIWYEIQISTPSFNAYGVSFPGIPSVVIGFNDSIAFGFTNGGIDVMDFYEIKFKDNSRAQYWFNNEWTNSRMRVEEIKVNGGRTIYDTVAYTVFGPVMYDKSFTNVSSGDKAFAIRWKAHDPSNELLMWWKLNRARNYDDYEKALQDFTCPVQNVVFASKAGDIAIWQQGQVPLRWNRQGVYIMPGEDSSYMWQGYIPMSDNPHIVNPERGFVSSANQRATSNDYPYYVPGDFSVYRGMRINKLLDAMNGITIADMMKLQNDNYNSMAEILKPFLVMHTDQARLNQEEKRLFQYFTSWNLQNDPAETGPVVFEVWMDTLSMLYLGDELGRASDPLLPNKSTLIDLLLKEDSISRFADNISTTELESVSKIVTESFKIAAGFLLKKEKENRLTWANYKNTTIYHLLGTGAIPFARQGLAIGGGDEIINATRHTHGPSWRMIIHLTTPTEAYGVYPGGQSGNPGSRYYSNFVDTWAAGKYYRSWFMRAGDKTDKRVKWVIKFGKAS
ncbi:MAG TPA: penicillin acylase family protein [Chitinophagaceae bacterium]|nr:penicillin acylase family protein [Chitinophagaceae bacterium]